MIVFNCGPTVQELFTTWQDPNFFFCISSHFFSLPFLSSMSFLFYSFLPSSDHFLHASPPFLHLLLASSSSMSFLFFSFLPSSDHFLHSSPPFLHLLLTSSSMSFLFFSFLPSPDHFLYASPPFLYLLLTSTDTK